MNRRGVFTNLWVINEEDEIRKVYTKTNCTGIMTDRGAHTKQMLIDFQGWIIGEVKQKEL